LKQNAESVVKTGAKMLLALALSMMLFLPASYAFGTIRYSRWRVCEKRKLKREICSISEVFAVRSSLSSCSRWR